MDSIQSAQAVAEWAEKGQTAAPPALRPLQLPDERLQFRAAPRAARPRQLLLLHALRQRGKALHRLRIARKAAQE